MTARKTALLVALVVATSRLPVHAGAIDSFGRVLIYKGTAGVDTVTIAPSGPDYTVTDAAGFSPGGTCTGSAPTFTCPGAGVAFMKIALRGGNDTLVATGVPVPLFVSGAAGNDDITGGDGDDRIKGGGGNDTIDSGPGSDMIYGNLGNDILDGGTDVDTIYGNGGVDNITATDGFADTVNCGAPPILDVFAVDGIDTTAGCP